MLGDENFTFCRSCDNGSIKGYYTRKDKNIEIAEKKFVILVMKETVICHRSYFLF